MFRIRLSKNMAKQVEGVKEPFSTKNEAWNHGIQKYGSGSYDRNFGWYIEEVADV